MKKILLRSLLFAGLCYVSLYFASFTTSLLSKLYYTAIIENRLYDYQYVYNCEMSVEDMRSMLYDVTLKSERVMISKIIIFVFTGIAIYCILGVGKHWTYIVQLTTYLRGLIREMLGR